MAYEISEEQCKQFASAFLLDKMINKNCTFPLFLEGNDTHLEDILAYMLSREYVDIQGNEKYIPTQKGRQVLIRFKKRYQDFLRNLDLYCAVDLESGEFAFEQFWEFEDEDSWVSYLEEERWEDLRVAVAVYKKLNPIEIVFMSFINEGRFEEENEGWQFDLLLGSTWDEILDICDSALSVEDLAYKDEDGNKVSSSEVMEDLLRQGAELCMELRNQEELYGEDEDEDDETGGTGETVVERVVVEEIGDDVYDGYRRDPFYVNPIWLAVLFI